MPIIRPAVAVLAAALPLAGLASSSRAQDCGPEARFEPFVAYDSANGTTNIDIGDVDGDGDLDLVTANEHDYSAGLFLNNGDGTFAMQRTYSYCDSPRDAKLADLDGDGDLDLVVVCLNSATLGVRLNVGLPHVFGALRMFNVGLLPETVTLRDFNSDGLPDALVSNYRLGVHVLLNAGDGSFEDAVLYPGESPRSATAEDANGDGFVDLIVPDLEASETRLYLGRGDGRFHAPTAMDDARRPHNAVLADIDADGDGDLLLTHGCCSNPYRLRVRRNNGTGGFGPPADYVIGEGAKGLRAGDLDLDGDVDVVVANRQRLQLSVLMNRGDGTFASQQLYAVRNRSENVILGDLDADGMLDITAATGNLWISVLINARRGACPTDFDDDACSTIFDFLAFANLFQAGELAADFDGDGDLTVLDFLAFQNAFDAGCP